MRVCVCVYGGRGVYTNLLVAGDRVHELDVQLGVVLGQRLVAIVADELHHRAEGEGVREAVLAVPMVDLYQLVVPTFPVGAKLKNKVTRSQRNGITVINVPAQHSLPFAPSQKYSNTHKK